MSVNYKTFFLRFFSANFIVRSLSFVKDLMLGWFIGPSKLLDIFFFLIAVPSFLSSTWNRALETVLLSNYEKDKHAGDNNVADQKISILIYNFSIISFLIFIIVSISLPVIVYYFYEEYSSNYLVYIVFIVNLVFVFDTYLLGIKVFCYSANRFFLPTILPVFQSIVIILGLLVTDKISLLLLSVLFTAGAIMQILFFLKKEFRFLITSIRNIWDTLNIRRYLKNVLQLSLASGLSSLNIIIDQFFALSLGEGANSYIHYGNYFVLIFTFLIVNNISTIFFPQFQKYALNDDRDRIISDTRKIVRIILIFNLFILIFVLNNGYYFLNSVLGYGKINTADLRIIYYCTVAYSGTFVGLAINAILVRILHVYNAYKIIVYVAALNSALNIILNVIFIAMFGVWGIALSTSVTLLVLITVYFIYLNKYQKINVYKDKNYAWIYRYLAVTGLIAVAEFLFIYTYDPLFIESFRWNIFVFLTGFVFIFSLSLLFKIIKIKKRTLLFE